MTVALSARDALTLATLKRLDPGPRKMCDLRRDVPVHQCVKEGDYHRIGWQMVGAIMRPLGQCRYCHDIQALDVFDG